MTKRNTKFVVRRKVANVREFIVGEVAAMEDGYGNTRAQAIRFVLDLLNEDEYADVLDYGQVLSAIEILHGMK